MNSNNLVPTNHSIDEALLLERVSAIIERRKYQAAAYANREVTLMYWEVGQYINSVILESKRASYGKQILATVSPELVARYGQGFETSNLYRMVKFATLFPDSEIVATLSPQLSWSHVREILPLKSSEARLYYATDAVQRRLGVRELRRQISRKAYERQEIANTQLTEGSAVPFNVFKDPYLLDTLGLRENFLEADLEKAILVELEAFILEFGHGFTFVERQKRMTIGEDDFRLDLLFYQRDLKRLVAVELKLERFRAAFKGQMELYLKWLNRYERRPDENEPIGLILCPTANRAQLELLEMDKAGIAVAEFWTHLPPKDEFTSKINAIMVEAKERLERRKGLPESSVKRSFKRLEPLNEGVSENPENSVKRPVKRLDYFYEPKDDDDD